MVVQRLVLIHPRELEIPNIQDFATTQEKAAAGDAAITMEKPGPEDCNILPEKNNVEKAKKAADFFPKKVSMRMAANLPPKKVSTEMAVDATSKRGFLEKANSAPKQDFGLVVVEDPEKVSLNSVT